MEEAKYQFKQLLCVPIQFQWRRLVPVEEAKYQSRRLCTIQTAEYQSRQLVPTEEASTNRGGLYQSRLQFFTFRFTVLAEFFLYNFAMYKTLKLQRAAWEEIQSNDTIHSKRQHIVSTICAAGSQIYFDVGKGWIEMHGERILKEWLHPHWIFSGQMLFADNKYLLLKGLLSAARTVHQIRLNF